MADSFEQILGKRRGKNSSIGPEMQSKRLARITEKALFGETAEAAAFLRRGNQLSVDEKKSLQEAILSGLILRSADELDLDYHWRRTLTSTSLFEGETPYILSGPGKLLHLSLGDQQALCGAKNNLFEAQRGRWQSRREGWRHCRECQQESDRLCDESLLASQESSELVPLSGKEASEIRRRLFQNLDFSGGQLTERARESLREEVCRCLSARLSDRSEEIITIMQRQMIRTSRLDIRKRAWAIWGLRDWSELDEKTWEEVAKVMFKEHEVRTTIWDALCQVMAQKEKSNRLFYSLCREILAHLVIRASREEREDNKNLKREKQQRRRAGW